MGEKKEEGKEGERGGRGNGVRPGNTEICFLQKSSFLPMELEEGMKKKKRAPPPKFFLTFQSCKCRISLGHG